MYGTGSVATVAFAELTGIASTATSAPSPETKAANRPRKADPETIAPLAPFITPPTSLGPKQRTDYTPGGVNGHRFLPTGGHLIPHWWPSFLPAGGHQISPPVAIVD